jgi:glucose-1-phosphate thymidylyltransferase
MKIDDDVMVLGSDNLFRFDMRKFVSFAMSKKPMASVAFYDIGDISKAHLYGIGKIDAGSGMLVDFLEKPKDPPSTLAATAIYFYPREVLGYFAEYMSKGASKDAPGNFVKYLVEKKQVFGYVFKEKWYDIGDIESLKKADNEYLRGD